MSTSLPTVTERLAKFVVDARFDDLPGPVVARMKDLLVHLMGLSFLGHSTAEGRDGIAVARRLGGPGTSRIVGERELAGLLDAVFAHTCLIGVEMDDFQIPSALHLGRVAQPVGWALGQRERRSGRELITALVAAYEATCKLAEAEPLAGVYARTPQYVYASMAAGIVAARMLRYDTRRVAQTLSYAAQFGLGLVEGGSEPAISGLLARNGVIAAVMADTIRTDVMTTIEGRNGMYIAFFGHVPEGLEQSLATLGRDYSVLRASTKRYPGSASHIAALELTRDLLDRSQLRTGEVDQLVVILAAPFRERFTFIERAIDGAAPSGGDISHSLRAKLAMLLVDGVIEPPTQERFGVEVRAMLPKVSLRFESGRTLDYTRVELITRDGRTLQAEGAVTPYPKGDWGTWLRKHGSQLLPESKLVRLEELLTNLEDVDDVSEIMACVVPD